LGAGDNGVSDLPRRDPQNAYREVGDEGALLVVPAQSTVEVLNPVGARIFSMLDGLHTREEIVRAVVDEFDIGEEEARRDLDDFLADLQARELLLPSGPPHTESHDE